jgi:23S rRNA (cytosine1962-C5)-methyltransferase
MAYPAIHLKPLRPERYGHPWVYDNEIAKGPDAGFEEGGLVRVIDHNKKPAGVAFLNRKSKIAARFLTRNPEEEINAGFWKKRIERALSYRKARYPDLPALYRLVYGEADLLPGLIVDVYGDCLVAQILTLGIERHREEIIEAMLGTLFPKTIYERSDSPTRKLEGLEEKAGLIRGPEPPALTEIENEGAILLVDIAHGAKTGLFLDQIENQKAVAREARGRDMLNCFAYTGLFGLRAALAGAKSVTDVEISAAFSEIGKKQWERNARAVCPHSRIVENAFDYLRMLEKNGYQTDMVVLDPPAFTKTRAQRDSALRGYNDINRRALRLLRPGGVLATCSCSHHITAEEFQAVVANAAKDAGREVRLIAHRGQPPDHPALLSVTESEYLKCLILAVD